MKLLKKINSTKGFTLIEMIVVLAVLTIILGFITSIFVQMIRVETAVLDTGQLDIIATECMSELIEDVRIAKIIDITTNPDVLLISTDQYTVMYSVDATEKILMREYAFDSPPQPKEVLSKGFYMGHYIDLAWAETGDPSTDDYAVTLNIVIFDSKDKEVYSEEYIVRPTFMNANG